MAYPRVFSLNILNIPVTGGSGEKICVFTCVVIAVSQLRFTSSDICVST